MNKFKVAYIIFLIIFIMSCLNLILPIGLLATGSPVLALGTALAATGPILVSGLFVFLTKDYDKCAV